MNVCMCPLPAHWLAIPTSFSYSQRYNTTGVGHIKNAKITFKYSSGRNTSNSYSRWKTRNNQSQVEKCVQNRGRQMASSIETVIFWTRRVKKKLKFPLQWLHIHNSKTERACYWQESFRGHLDGRSNQQQCSLQLKTNPVEALTLCYSMKPERWGSSQYEKSWKLAEIGWCSFQKKAMCIT